ncbi:MAG: OmpA family protein [Sandaracinus sp.]
MIRKAHKLAGIVLVTVLAYAAVGCGPSDTERRAVARVAELEGQLHDSEEQRQQLEAHLHELEAQNQQMADRLEALGQDVEGLRAQRTELQGTLDETQRALDELRAREAAASARLATFRQMLERFRAMIDSGQLHVRVVRNRMVVELPDNVLFDSGEAELKPEGQATLQSVGQILMTIEGRQFQVAGHTDSVPVHGRRWASNWELSTARAVSVARFLIGAGMPADRLSAAGYADTQPVDTNDTDEGRAHNRRIEIVLVPNIDELPDLSALTGDHS